MTFGLAFWYELSPLLFPPLFPLLPRIRVAHPFRAFPGRTFALPLPLQDEVRREFFLNVRTVHEGSDTQKLGTSGGLKKFRADVERGDPDHVFVLHGDVVCDFPLYAMFDTHLKHSGACTLLGTRVSKDDAKFFGVLGLSPEVSGDGLVEVLHYAEKPETFVSDVISCGVYVFRRDLLYKQIEKITGSPALRMSSSFGMSPDSLSLELDVVANLCGDKQVFLHETDKFFLQIKTAGMTIPATKSLLGHLKVKFPHELAKEDNEHIVGNVWIHKTARVDPTARLGPDVTIGPGVTIQAGARVRNSVILDYATIGKRSCTLNSVVGWGSTIAEWARVEGVMDFSQMHDPAASNIAANLGVTVLGADVSVASGSVVRSVIALPHKSLSGNVERQIVL
jgi:mannose-1-phosphate guanylyltransferase